MNSAVAIAVSIFNDGASSVGQMLRKMDLAAGVFACDFFQTQKHIQSHHCSETGKTGFKRVQKA